MNNLAPPFTAVEWEHEVRYKNGIWDDYRIKGWPPHRTAAEEARLRLNINSNHYQPPNPAEPLAFFDNFKWVPRQVGAPVEDKRVDLENTIDPQINPQDARAQRRYRDLLRYFAKPQFTPQRVLGYGGHGLACHFRYHGLDASDSGGSDIVIKVALDDWQSDDIRWEREMLRKVAGSAHTVQTVNPSSRSETVQDALLSVPRYKGDTTDDSESSGNESSTPNEVIRRHRGWKRKIRTLEEREAKKRRMADRDIFINTRLEILRKQGLQLRRKDFIVLEYVPHGTLATLMRRLASHKAQDERLQKIPNRVLWEFWLCMVRACIAMEYPPRKFHPYRKKPDPTTLNSLVYVQSLANNMIYNLKETAARVFRYDQYDRVKALHDQLQGDLIENVPVDSQPGEPPGWKLERTQNMVHHDIDPTNILIAGFELDDSSRADWEETRREMFLKRRENRRSDASSLELPPDQRHPNNMDKKPDRIPGEHEWVPRLKLSDFGISVCVKQRKNNMYYTRQRGQGKVGYYAPEDFGPEWNRIPMTADTYELCRSQVCGNWTNKTNIYGIAFTMWRLITNHLPPLPPMPQPPYEEVDNYPPINSYGQTNIDLALQDEKYKDFKISYCPWLMDPKVTDYDWVDKDLRQTIFECMYHKPDDRPTLEALLRAAEDKVLDEFPGETDDLVREWIQYWLFDYQERSHSIKKTRRPRPKPKPKPKRPERPPVQMDPVKAALLQQLAREDNNNPRRLQLLVQLNTDFPDGYSRVPNAEPGLLCGFRAVVDSFKHQLGEHPVINGVTLDLTGLLPTIDDLQEIHSSIEWGNWGLEGAENINASALGLVVHEWGMIYNIDLELGYVLQSRALPFGTTNHHENPRFIWIHNNNAQDLAILHDLPVPEYNHYEGLRPRFGPRVADEGAFLPHFGRDAFLDPDDDPDLLPRSSFDEPGEDQLPESARLQFDGGAFPDADDSSASMPRSFFYVSDEDQPPEA
ncbi:hypothetical protein GGS21DRAFT_544035 [Xylaria nigripes]|nr:hypothetical protein GGS21DRAFT_544035 [Xylaria nigripes]